MIAFRFRLKFEDYDEIMRVIEILSNQSVKRFHESIQKSINFNASTPSAFQVVDDSWRSKMEINNNEGNKNNFENTLVSDLIQSPHQRLRYITKGDEEWTIKIELIKIFKFDDTLAYPRLVKSEMDAPPQFVKKNKFELGLKTNEFDTLAQELIQKAKMEDISSDEFIIPKDSPDSSE
ncbi:MAG: hypothetical protein CBB99_00820 [Bacteroidetes bacterium TMED39]|nr:MAG: hypothetical protein CBB99_00820 [Bacteroidetes bacterium TMED39]